MRFSWNINEVCIETSFNDGSVLKWTAVEWSKTSNFSYELFTPLNRYLALLPQATLLSMQDLYEQAHVLLTDVTDSTETLDKLNKVTGAIMDSVKWDHLHFWCITVGRLFLEPGVKEELDDKDRREITYFTREYEDLMVASVYTKLIMPIWGEFHKELKKVLGKHFTQLRAIELIRTPTTVKLPFWTKLDNYVRSFADLRITSTGFSVLSQIGTEEIPDYLFAIAIIKKVVIHDPCLRGPEVKSIITNIYNFLNDSCVDISRNKPRDKKRIDESGEEVAIANRYKMVERINRGAMTLIELECEDITRLAQLIEPTVTVETLEYYKRRLDLTFDITDMHLMICGVVVNEVIGTTTMSIIGYAHVLNVITSVASALHHRGYDDLALLLTCTPAPRDPTRMSISGNTGLAFTPISNVSVDNLKNLYPHISVDKNPGLVFVETIGRELLRNNWPIDHPLFPNVRNRLSDMLFEFGTSKPISKLTKNEVEL